MAERAAKAKKKSAKSKDKKPRKMRDDTAPMPTGSNVPDEVIERHVRKITQTGAVLETAKGKHRQAYSEAKDDGVNIDALKLALKLHTKRDHGQVATDYADAGRILRVMDSPLATQLELFQGIDTDSPYAEGERVGRAGGPAEDNKYDPGTEKFVKWAEGWAKGQEKTQDAFLAGQGAPVH